MPPAWNGKSRFFKKQFLRDLIIKSEILPSAVGLWQATGDDQVEQEKNGTKTKLMGFLGIGLAAGLLLGGLGGYFLNDFMSGGGSTKVCLEGTSKAILLLFVAPSKMMYMNGK